MLTNRRTFLQAALASSVAARAIPAQNPPPNIIFILADDLGYGDLGCYGSDIPTPNIDRMAWEGVRFEQFYAASPVCSPSRAALMTGRYPARVGVQRVLQAADTDGLSLTETTLPEVLKTQGYRTMCVGKWHLGSKPEYMPTKRGFDQFFGLPYSNDMSPLPLMQNTTVVEQPANLNLLTRRYTEAALNFIAASRNTPFFLYFAHTFPHIPLAVSGQFKGKSGLGLYADCVEEIDWSVGQILNLLKAQNLDKNTLVMFSSDNGPWFLGSPGKLRGRKGETYEGGMREPFIARFPGRIPALGGPRNTPRRQYPAGRSTRAIATMMDILPTVAGLAGASLPAKPPDGVDIWPILSGAEQTVDRPPFLYFDDWNLQCARVGRWKLHVSRYNSVAWGPVPRGGRLNLPLFQPELYDLELDPEESYNLAPDHPDIVAQIRSQMEAALLTFPPQAIYAWQQTMSRQVAATPDGALPVPATP